MSFRRSDRVNVVVEINQRLRRLLEDQGVEEGLIDAVTSEVVEASGVKAVATGG